MWMYVSVHPPSVGTYSSQYVALTEVPQGFSLFAHLGQCPGGQRSEGNDSEGPCVFFAFITLAKPPKELVPVCALPRVSGGCLLPSLHQHRVLCFGVYSCHFPPRKFIGKLQKRAEKEGFRDSTDTRQAHAVAMSLCRACAPGRGHHCRVALAVTLGSLLAVQ